MVGAISLRQAMTSILNHALWLWPVRGTPADRSITWLQWPVVAIGPTWLNAAISEGAGGSDARVKILVWVIGKALNLIKSGQYRGLVGIREGPAFPRHYGITIE